MRVLEIEEVTVEIGQKPLIEDIFLTLETGKIKGLIGHNGAGKTTLLRSIIGLQEKQKGKITIDHVHDQKEDILAFKKLISYLPEEPVLLTELTVKQHFQLYGISYEMPEVQLEEILDYYLKGFELEDQLDAYPEELSKGMRQKVQTICAFLPDVPFILIDEPFMGLDIYAIDFFEEIVLQKRNEGVGILLTTHQLDQIRKIADQFIMLQQGKVNSRGNIKDFDTIQRGTEG